MTTFTPEALVLTKDLSDLFLTYQMTEIGGIHTVVSDLRELRDHKNRPVQFMALLVSVGGNRVRGALYAVAEHGGTVIVSNDADFRDIHGGDNEHIAYSKKIADFAATKIRQRGFIPIEKGRILAKRTLPYDEPERSVDVYSYVRR